MALAHYSPFLDRPLPIQSKHPYLLSVAQKQVLPMSNPYSWNKSTSGLESWDAPQTSWTIDSSYSTLQSAVPPSEPTTSQAASGAHPLQQHPLPEPRCDSSLSRLELGHLPSHSPGLRGLDPTIFRFPPGGGDLLYAMDDGFDVEHAALMTHKSPPKRWKKQGRSKKRDACSNSSYVSVIHLRHHHRSAPQARFLKHGQPRLVMIGWAERILRRRSEIDELWRLQVQQTIRIGVIRFRPNFHSPSPCHLAWWNAESQRE
jgi:hypothetical protein